MFSFSIGGLFRGHSSFEIHGDGDACSHHHYKPLHANPEEHLGTLDKAQVDKLMAFLRALAPVIGLAPTCLLYTSVSVLKATGGNTVGENDAAMGDPGNAGNGIDPEVLVSKSSQVESAGGTGVNPGSSDYNFYEDHGSVTPDQGNGDVYKRQEYLII